MRHLSACLLVVAVLGMTSGCSLIDRLFLINADGPYSNHYAGCPAGCEDGCEHCNEAPCVDCQSGICPTAAVKTVFVVLGKTAMTVRMAVVTKDMLDDMVVCKTPSNPRRTM